MQKPSLNKGRLEQKAPTNLEVNSHLVHLLNPCTCLQRATRVHARTRPQVPAPFSFPREARSLPAAQLCQLSRHRSGTVTPPD